MREAMALPEMVRVNPNSRPRCGECHEWNWIRDIDSSSVRPSLRKFLKHDCKGRCDAPDWESCPTKWQKRHPKESKSKKAKPTESSMKAQVRKQKKEAKHNIHVQAKDIIEKGYFQKDSSPEELQEGLERLITVVKEQKRAIAGVKKYSYDAPIGIHFPDGTVPTVPVLSAVPAVPTSPQSPEASGPREIIDLTADDMNLEEILQKRRAEVTQLEEELKRRKKKKALEDAQYGPVIQQLKEQGLNLAEFVEYAKRNQAPLVDYGSE
eukprot:TRINITY_DN11448_c0_g1_i2.p1 TRINITY_DN11448_c0_g1~~TRINITY_DN11448_c0_g1_i2.p1  ORF type:complete len:266 (-),score=42.11 TRINITY_DN11448_c0_g1_i2:18-815(-)